MKINILGHEYSVLHIAENDIPDDLKRKLEDSNGLCENFSQELIITKIEDAPGAYRRLDLLENKIGIHEMLHAYFFKSGLHQLFSSEAHEAIVDMLAINLENIYKNSLKIKKFLKEDD